MIVAIHQPNYLPWLGYFYKILRADVFVYHDAVPFSRSSYTRRCRIQVAKGSLEQDWLSIPVKHLPEGTPIPDIDVDESRDWRAKHLNKISNTYASAPCFADVFPVLKDGLDLSRDGSALAALNISLIEHLCRAMGIEVQFRYSSDFNFNTSRSLLNLDIARELGASTYLSGTGALQYEETDAFAKHNIMIEVADVKAWLEVNPYAQDSSSFMGGLSVIDALMNLGFTGTRVLLDRMVAELQPIRE